MNKIHVSKEQMLLIQMILAKYLDQNYIVWAFGSRVSGKNRKYSDLDLAIESKSHILSAQLLVDLKNAFTDSELPWEVDVVDYLQLSAEFRNVVDSNRTEIKF